MDGGEVLKPSINPMRRRGRIIFNFALSAEIFFFVLGIILENPRMMIFSFVAFTIFPSVFFFFGLFHNLVMSVTVYDDKLVIKNYFPWSYLPTGIQQEIAFEDIDYIYYLYKEYNLLKNYRRKLKRYEIPEDETDYTRNNLIRKYAVPAELIDSFEQSSQQTLSDGAVTEVIMAVDNMADKYRVPRGERKKVIKYLKKTDRVDFERIKKFFAPYNVSSQDFDELKDVCSECDTSVESPLFTTRLDVPYAEKLENEMDVMISFNSTLVFSNKDGAKKVYLKYFHSLSRTNWQKLIHTINEKKTGIKYLMPKINFRNLTDPNFKPGVA